MDEWNKGELDSFLIEITANILKFKDDKGETLLPHIRDAAGQVAGFSKLWKQSVIAERNRKMDMFCWIGIRTASDPHRRGRLCSLPFSIEIGTSESIQGASQAHFQGRGFD